MTVAAGYPDPPSLDTWGDRLDREIDRLLAAREARKAGPFSVVQFEEGASYRLEVRRIVHGFAEELDARLFAIEQAWQNIAVRQTERLPEPLRPS
jgi:hypothetical protein